ncbi:MAG: hypothetical protein RMJ07_05485 [Nitrososphaerota archaeon]|nr:hypothetical protein [Candidatus Bathyarchaeota archaeon]MDW8049114.1 hypothetical protein [Nitrososphaerota archaeon]
MVRHTLHEIGWDNDFDIMRPINLFVPPSAFKTKVVYRGDLILYVNVHVIGSKPETTDVN